MKLRSRRIQDEHPEAITWIGGMMLRFVAQTTGHGQYPPERWREFVGKQTRVAERHLALYPQS